MVSGWASADRAATYLALCAMALAVVVRPAGAQIDLVNEVFAVDGSLPPGWSKAETGGGNGWNVGDPDVYGTGNWPSGFANSPGGSLNAYAIDDAGENQWGDLLILPLLDLSRYNSPTLEFSTMFIGQAHALGKTQTLSVVVSNNNGTSWDFIPPIVIPGGFTWATFTFSAELVTLAGQPSISVAFNTSDGRDPDQATGASIDDVIFQAIPNCGNGGLDPGEECDDGVANSDTGSDACRTTCLLPSCGDGVIDSGEECDDALLNHDTMGDACRTNCTAPFCGDGVIDSGETCDNGTSLNNDTAPNACRSGCVVASCGDSVVDSGEVCDDGLAVNSDTLANRCREDCLPARCGDGVKDTGEACDDGGANAVLPNACRPNCRVGVCGDGIHDSDTEACDDGGNVDDDGCDKWCQLEPTATCTTANATSPSVCVFCGDGSVDGPEGCDDGVAANSDTAPDACRTTCVLPSCGDGVVDAAEACDDGGNDNGDGCSSACTVEPGFVCVGLAPSLCNNCGNGLLEGVEECDDGGGGGGGGNNDTLPNACRTDCALPACGDGVVDTGESCDDGNGGSGDGCSSACVVESGDGWGCTGVAPSVCQRCGNGVIEGTEACDDGFGANDDNGADACRLDCSLPSCGDSVIDAGEACDDGNSAAGDGCVGCAISPGWVCFPAAPRPGDPSRCQLASIICGDGVVAGIEECDLGPDNNDYAPNGCRADCRAARCGDGVRDSGEVCEDGGAVGGDGCAANCTVEPGWTCGPYNPSPSNPSTCSNAVLPHVVSVVPDSGTIGVGVGEGVVITFSVPMDPTATESATVVSCCGVASLEGSFEWSDDWTTVVFTPLVRPAPDSQVTVRVGVGASDRSLTPKALFSELATTYVTEPYRPPVESDSGDAFVDTLSRTGVFTVNTSLLGGIMAVVIIMALCVVMYLLLSAKGHAGDEDDDGSALLGSTSLESYDEYGSVDYGRETLSSRSTMSDVTVDGLEGASNSSGNYEMPALVSDGGDVTEANTTVNLSAVDFLGDDSFAMATEMAGMDFRVGDVIVFKQIPCVVRYVGPIPPPRRSKKDSPASYWYGLETDPIEVDGGRGQSDGRFRGRRIFRPERAGLNCFFVRVDEVHDGLEGFGTVDVGGSGDDRW